MNIQLRAYSAYPDLSLEAADLFSWILYLQEGGTVYLKSCNRSAIAELVGHKLISVEAN